MRFLTLAEHQLLDSLPAVEAAVVRFFLTETDARLVTEGAGDAPRSPRTVPAPSPTSPQENLWGEAA